MIDQSPPAKTGTARVERWLARGFVFLMVLAVGLGAALAVDQMLLRERGRPRTAFEQLNPGIGWKPVPYAMFTGYRHPLPPPEKPPGERRVFLLGGSTVWTGEPTYAELIEKQLAADGHRQVKVINLGVASQCSGQELARLVFDVADLQPDLIVMHSGGNDLIQVMTADPRPGYPYNYLIFERNPLLPGFEDTVPLWCWALRQTYFGQGLAHKVLDRRITSLDRLREEVSFGQPDWTRRVAEAYAGHVARAQLVSQAFGARFLASFQPTLLYKDHLAPEEVGCFGHEYMREHLLAAREHIRRRFDELEATQQLESVDLSDVYDDVTAQVFTDSIHTIQEYIPQVAQRLYEEIRDRRLLEPNPQRVPRGD